jgi:hypothetical protein
MKKQFLSILAAGLMLGGVSQIKAMDAKDIQHAATVQFRATSIKTDVDPHDEYNCISADTGYTKLPNGSSASGLSVVCNTYWHSDSPNLCSQKISSQKLTSVPLPKVKEQEPLAQYIVRLNTRAQLLLNKYAHMFVPPVINPLLLQGPVDPQTKQYSRLRVACAPIKLENDRYTNGLKATLEKDSSRSNPWTARQNGREIASVVLPPIKDGETPEQYQQRITNMAMALMFKHASQLPLDARKLTWI